MKQTTAILALAAPLALLLASSNPRADVRLPAVISDGMVVQREAKVPIWGWAEPGEMVRITPGWLMEGNTALMLGGRADENGRWRFAIPTKGAGGPFTLRISGKNEIVVEDVWVGEVWLCSGQSNMEWKIRQCESAIENVESVRAKQSWPRLRLFDVENTITMTPEEDCKGVWKACTPENWSGWGAVAFYFGRELLQELDVPIGLITSDWGGTPAEAWTSRKTIRSLADFAPSLERIDAALGSGDASPTQEELQAAWWRGVDEKDPGSPDWSAADLDVSEWRTTAQPARWSATPGLEAFDGIVWVRREVTLPAAWAGRDLSLALGPIDDMDTTWFNGEKVGGFEAMGYWSTDRTFQIPGRLVRAGSNSIAIRVLDTGGEGGLTGDPQKLSIGLKGGLGPPALLLSGEWRYRVGASAADLGPFPSTSWFDAHYPTSLYNGMIAPLVPYRIRGAIWYQGESNRDRAAQYRTLFPAMIEDWREIWGQGDFPFYFVQIAPYRYGDDTGQAAELREAQTMTLSLPSTGMAVTMDIGNPDDIHPKNKWEVGRRLSLWALAKDYGREDLVFSGPLFKGFQKEGSSMRLLFAHAGGGLSSLGGPLAHFTIAGEDRVFHPAKVEIDGETLLVSSEQVPEPAAVRYAWGCDDEPNLANLAGLPASSFRTDEWERK